MIDIETLLEPISDSAPSGEDLSFSAEFDAILEARRSDDASLDQGEWVTDLKSADWFGVSKQCGHLLGTRSKDLRLAVWMAEASTQLDGFAGLIAGYTLVAGLCDRFWDSIHPVPDTEADADDQDLRIGNLGWLLTQSIQWIGAIPLIDGAQGRYGVVVLEAAARGHQSDSEGEQQSYPDAAHVDAARAATPFEFYRRLAEQAPQALQAFNQLESAVDARLGQDGPSFSATRDALTNAIAMALRFASAAGVAVTESARPPSLPGDDTATPTNSTTTPNASNGAINNRREALAQLRLVAEFFRRTEPHSPVAYLADKAARWGNMPLHVWLKSVLKDNPVLGQLEEMLDVGADESRNAQKSEG
ncbi:MAG: type VI secretion system protein TssA [Rhodanobacter sp.]